MPQKLCSSVDNPETVKLLVTVTFRIGSGVQYDRNYAFLIGDTTVSAGILRPPVEV